MLSDKKNKGFTLMELLIVVAIIAILVAVSIPVFSTSIEKAEEAVCLANRRSLKGLIVTAYLSGGDMDAAFNDNKANFKCPKDGVLSYTFDEAAGYVNIECSVHLGGSSVFSSLYQAYIDNNINVNVINSSALADPNSRATVIFNSLDRQQQALLRNYTWTINSKTANGLRIFFADKDKVENGEFPLVYKLNPVSGKYQVSQTATRSNYNTSNGVVQITGGTSDWGAYVNGVFVKDGWMDALPADLSNPKAG